MKVMRTLIWHVPPWKRDEIPLLYYQNECIAVIDYAVADQWRAAKDEKGIVINIKCL